jgi:hypothetical protein
LWYAFAFFVVIPEGNLLFQSLHFKKISQIGNVRKEFSKSWRIFQHQISDTLNHKIHHKLTTNHHPKHHVCTPVFAKTPAKTPNPPHAKKVRIEIRKCRRY